MDYPKVKITGRYNNDFKIFIDGVKLNNVIDVSVKFGMPHEVTVKMFADVDIDTCANVDCKQIVHKNGKTYVLQEVKPDHET